MNTFKSLAAKIAAAVLLLSMSYSCDKLPADADADYEGNLVHYFPFSGNSTDEVSGQTYETKGTNFLTDRNERPASSLFFNGLDSWMDMGAVLDSKEGTLSFWIFPCLCKKFNPLFVKKSVEDDPYFGNQYVGYSEEGKIETVRKGKWNVETDIVIQANKWYHVVVRWDDAKGLVDIFVNAKKVFSKEYTVDPSEVSSGTGETYLGKVLNKSGESIQTVHYKGKLDEVRLYNIYLPFDEIKALYSE